eukprot:Rhum_TRINITY_DN9758_c0_g2::Rhum_TRINITY_DN9758_c0_g2_i1::g.34981::m.34981
MVNMGPRDGRGASRSRQTVLNGNPHHPINTTSCVNRKKNGGAATSTSPPRSRGGSPAAAAAAAKRAGRRQGSVVRNQVEFKVLAEMDEDDEAQLEAENSLLRWKVQQLAATGEQYRQKVEGMYIESKAHQMDLQKQIQELKASKGMADDTANQAAASLAVANASRSKLDQGCSEAQSMMLQVNTRVSDYQQRLKRKLVDTALAENDHEHLTRTLSTTNETIEQLTQKLAETRSKRQDLLAAISDAEQQKQQHLADAAACEAELQEWESENTVVSSEVRNLVSRLDAAVADCIQLSRTACALAPYLDQSAGMSVGSPPACHGLTHLTAAKVEETAGDLRDLQEANKKLLEDSQRVETEVASKLRAAEQREQEWQALSNEWGERESNWKRNLRAILFDE